MKTVTVTYLSERTETFFNVIHVHTNDVGHFRIERLDGRISIITAHVARVDVVEDKDDEKQSKINE